MVLRRHRTEPVGDGHLLATFGFAVTEPLVKEGLARPAPLSFQGVKWSEERLLSGGLHMFDDTLGLSAKCRPLWVKSGSRGASAMRPVLPQQQTSLGSVGTSV